MRNRANKKQTNKHSKKAKVNITRSCRNNTSYWASIAAWFQWMLRVACFCAGSSVKVAAAVGWCVHTGHGSPSLSVERQRSQYLRET